MKFRRKSRTERSRPEEETSAPGGSAAQEAEETREAERTPAHGPWDVDEVPESDTLRRVDLGSLRIAPVKDRELRLQVDEKTQAVQAVLLTGEDSALEIRVFAAPRHGDLWSDARQQIAAQAGQRGGTATERQGRWGPEVLVQMPVKLKDGSTGTQTSRILGINGDRWMLRATLMGRAAVEGEVAVSWEGQLATTVVDRGREAMPVGEALPLTMPDEARKVR